MPLKTYQYAIYLVNYKHAPVCMAVDIDAEYIREMVYMLVDDLYVRRDKRSLVEQRLEDLETRVTEQSLNYQVLNPLQNFPDVNQV